MYDRLSARKEFDDCRHLPPALPPVSDGKDLSAIGVSRLSENASTLPGCQLRFEREPGYFLGAMYISYGLGVVIIASFAAALWAATGWWITKATVWAAVLFLPLAPAITYFSRILWIYLDQTFDPDRS